MAKSRSLGGREVVVAIDLGTSACKVVAFDRSGKRVAYGRNAYGTSVDATGRVEQDPRAWWKAVKSAIRISGLKDHRTRIVAYTVSSLRAAVLPVDSRGRPLASAILAPDLRADVEAKWLSQRLGEREAYEKTGLRISMYASLPRILWLKKNKPNVFSPAAKILCAQDFLIHKLTGRTVTDLSHASRTLCFNIHTKSWDPEIMRVSRLSHELLPDLIDPGSVVGGLQSAVAHELGIPVAPVVAAGGDQMCASVGLGGVSPGQVTINHGTGSFVETPTNQPIVDPSAGSFSSVHVLPNHWIQEFPLLTTGRILEGLLNTFQGSPSDSLQLINAALSQPVSATQYDPLIFLPYQAGATAPHWSPRLPGVIWGLKSHHCMSDIVRSFFQSIVFDLRRCIAKLRTTPREISVGGRLANSKQFNQMQADILGVSIVRTAEPEATALGSAALAFAALGIYASPQHAVQVMVRRIDSGCFRPRSNENAIYQGLFEAQEKILKIATEQSKG